MKGKKKKTKLLSSVNISTNHPMITFTSLSLGRTHTRPNFNVESSPRYPVCYLLLPLTLVFLNLP